MLLRVRHCFINRGRLSPVATPVFLATDVQMLRVEIERFTESLTVLGKRR
jgi:hypothetical protein